MTMSDPNRQREIAEALGVRAQIDPQDEISRRVDFLVDYLRRAHAGALVLGISGGVDSTVCGRLCQLAVERLRESGGTAHFYAMRLPHGDQHDADDVSAALRFIAPDETIDVDIAPPTDGMKTALANSGMTFDSDTQEDFVIGNVKARQRMIAQYAVAGRYHGMVVGTDHAAEAVMGFFTKFGDGAADIMPLHGLTKRQVRAIGQRLCAPDHLVHKQPTADLESLQPQQPDEMALGVRYEQIDSFLEGGDIDDAARERIVNAYDATGHKRALPATP